MGEHANRGHSRLGASGAERWMNCPGSVALIARLRGELDKMEMPEEDDPDYRREGTAMHEAAEHCLNTGLDTWEIVGQTFNNTVIDAPMADAIQVYLDVCRRDIDHATWHQVEYQISSPVHPDFYGTADFTAVIVEGPVLPKTLAEENPNVWLLVRDLKGGEGILVEPEENPQGMYYAYGVIDEIERRSAITLHPNMKVVISIVQPRAYHPSGEVVREWETTVGYIKAWVKDELLPAMASTELDHTLDAGPWCRFCPAKLVCPLLVAVARAAATHNPKEIVTYSDENIGREYQYVQAIKFYIKALEEEAFRRLNYGRRMEGQVKLVPKKAHRVWSVGAAEIKAKFGDKAMTTPEVKSPAELEKMSPEAKAFVKEHAYMPQTGLTVALWDDSRPEVIIRSTAETFGAALDGLVDKD